MRLRARALAPLLAAALLLTGCTEAAPSAGGDDPLRTWQQWTDPTTAPVVFSGRTVDGAAFDSTRYAGKVLVVNFWYAGCAPCRAEAPTLRSLSQRFAGDGVQFVGVNTRDDAVTAAAFDRRLATGYPSIVDQAGGGAVQLAFASARGPNTTPTTLVLDRRGRVTARISGLANESVLRTFVQDALDGAAA